MGLPHVATITVLWVQILLQTPQVEGQWIKMTMEYNAFDDQYKGCENKMDSIAHRLLQHEKKNNRILQYAWAKAQNKWYKEIKKKVYPLPSGFRDKYGIALVMYTDNRFYPHFNLAMRTNGRSLNYYKKYFRYKAVHFYLTRALQLLPKISCTTWLYRGVKRKFIHLGTGPIRFGQFTSTSRNCSISKNFDEKKAACNSAHQAIWWSQAV
ncbi:T-cell ecto-ADP-ribosyltransferase 2-like [Tachyglossus aculeatus]|uniref:T-cell ecto-ADP-ribosyltransferase 2-like n=1 Tax=Tachyglossus aculeatus TaxID=9261 RepID=UPI0018F4D221|nr:T-cell ecto-ADP-ribosyltransferase 2-like [Tachyglossus aculeatus]